jgi:hypothetical protein
LAHLLCSAIIGVCCVAVMECLVNGTGENPCTGSTGSSSREALSRKRTVRFLVQCWDGAVFELCSQPTWAHVECDSYFAIDPNRKQPVAYP